MRAATPSGPRQCAGSASQATTWEKIKGQHRHRVHHRGRAEHRSPQPAGALRRPAQRQRRCKADEQRQQRQDQVLAQQLEHFDPLTWAAQVAADITEYRRPASGARRRVRPRRARHPPRRRRRRLPRRGPRARTTPHPARCAWAPLAGESIPLAATHHQVRLDRASPAAGRQGPRPAAILALPKPRRAARVATSCTGRPSVGKKDSAR